MPNEPSASFVRRVLTVVAVSTAVLVALLLGWHAISVLLTLFAGVLVAVLLRGLATWLSARSGWSASLSLVVVCIGLAVALAALLAFAAASISQQFSEMFDRLPAAVEQARDRLEANPLGRRVLAPLSQAQENGGGLPMSRVLGVASGTLGAFGTLVVVIFLGIFLAADPGVYRRGALLLLPPARRPRVETVMDETGETLWRWLGGRLLLMAVIGVLTWIGLLLLGVPLALALAILAGMLSFIPNLGPVISVVPAILLAATESPMLAVWVAVLYLGIQSAESYVLEPFIVRRTVSLPPATNIVFQLFMGTWLGIMGLTLATPMLAMLTVVLTRLYVEDVLGEPEGRDR